jgi:hypothetical protein
VACQTNFGLREHRGQCCSINFCSSRAFAATVDPRRNAIGYADRLPDRENEESGIGTAKQERKANTDVAEDFCGRTFSLEDNLEKQSHDNVFTERSSKSNHVPRVQTLDGIEKVPQSVWRNILYGSGPGMSCAARRKECGQDQHKGCFGTNVLLLSSPLLLSASPRLQPCHGTG